MMDFISPELVQARQIDREIEVGKQRRIAEARELDVADEASPRNLRRLRLHWHDKVRRRRQLFASALEAAQREGITVDAWFGFRFADPELSARAEWAGLIDDAGKTVQDVWAA